MPALQESAFGCGFAALLCVVVATDSAFLSVGFSVQDEPTVNQRQIDRGYQYELYLKGRHIMMRGGLEDVSKAIDRL